jgi:hypothetical protein
LNNTIKEILKDCFDDLMKESKENIVYKPNISNDHNRVQSIDDGSILVKSKSNNNEAPLPNSQSFESPIGTIESMKNVNIIQETKERIDMSTNVQDIRKFTDIIEEASSSSLSTEEYSHDEFHSEIEDVGDNVTYAELNGASQGIQDSKKWTMEEEKSQEPASEQTKERVFPKIIQTKELAQRIKREVIETNISYKTDPKKKSHADEIEEEIAHEVEKVDIDDDIETEGIPSDLEIASNENTDNDEVEEINNSSNHESDQYSADSDFEAKPTRNSFIPSANKIPTNYVEIQDWEEAWNDEDTII